MKLTEEWQKYQHFYHKYQGKTDKCKYLTGEEILTFRQHWMIEQAKVSYSPLGKAFEKQIKTIDNQGKSKYKQLKSMGNNYLNLMQLQYMIMILKKIAKQF